MEGRVSGMWSAVRYGARGLVRAPQFTLAASLTLALAIGANASIFSVVQGILLKPLAFRDADELVSLHHTAPGLGYDRFGVSPGTYSVYRDHGAAFESSGLFVSQSVNVTGDDAPPDRLQAARVTHGVFATLGTAAALGRAIGADDETPGAAPVVVLSDGVWRERFGSDPGVLGTVMRIDGTARTVIGVMPQGFAFPTAGTRLWVPLAMDTAAARDPGNFSFGAVARLRPGLDAQQGEQLLQPALERIREEFGEGGDFPAFMDAGKLAPVVISLKELVVGDVGRPLWILLGTVGFVFLIACANVTNLFLVRAEARQKEMAVRSAMGAGRRGLIGHYAAESALVALIGGAVGLFLAWIGLRALLRAAPPGLPRLAEVALDPLVLLFTFGATVLAAVLLSIVPSVRLTSPDLLATLSRSGRGSTAGRERNRARQALVVVQTALALVLLVGSGLMVRSYRNLRALDPGFDPSSALTFRISLPGSAYDDGRAVASFHAQLLDRLRQLPGVESVGATSHQPLAGCCSGTAHVLEDQPVAPGSLPPMFWYSTVSDGYFEAMGIPLVEGRAFTSAERDSTASGVIVSEALARKYWPEGSALGKRLRLSDDSAGWYAIVGVAGNVRDRALVEEPSEMVYWPMGATTERDDVGQVRSMSYVIRTPRPDDVAPLARREVWALDPDLPIAESSTLETIVSDNMVRMSFTMLALVVASAIALLLGAVGLYGVISYLVTQRAGEIGIRLALGARPSQVRRMVTWQGVRLAAIGLVLGFGGALALTRLMQGILFETEPTDPVTFASVSVFLAGVALCASYLPALRASRIDPAASLKSE